MQTFLPLPGYFLLTSLLDYNPHTGIWFWRPRVNDAHFNILRANKPAGYIDQQGYLLISIAGIKYKAHRLAYRWMLDLDPGAILVDHANKIRDDNRWSNLRLATHSENGANAHLSVRNKTGVKGVLWREREGKYEAHIRVNRRLIYLGKFHDIDQAANTRRAAASFFWPEHASH